MRFCSGHQAANDDDDVGLKLINLIKGYPGLFKETVFIVTVVNKLPLLVFKRFVHTIFAGNQPHNLSEVDKLMTNKRSRYAEVQKELRPAVDVQHASLVIHHIIISMVTCH